MEGDTSYRAWCPCGQATLSPTDLWHWGVLMNESQMSAPAGFAPLCVSDMGGVTRIKMLESHLDDIKPEEQRNNT